jgi:hypothetical protein
MVDVTLSGKIGVRFLSAKTVFVDDPRNPGQKLARDRITYAAPGLAHLAQTSEYASILMKDKVLWPAIEPAYNAWKSNNELPETGTPFAAWSGVTSEEADVLKNYGIRTVEEMADLSDTLMQRIPLPNLRARKDMAQRFLASADNRKVEQALAEKDAELADLRAKLDNLATMMAEKMDADEAPRRGPGRPRKEAAE